MPLPGFQEPWIIPCDGLCCRGLNANLDIDTWKSLYFSNSLIGALIVVNLVYLFVRLNRSYASGQGDLLKVYHAYCLVMAAWFSISILTLLLPPNFLSFLLEHILYIGRAFMDNWVIFIAIFEPQSHPVKAIMATFVVVAVKLGAMFTFFLDQDCGFCPMFYPAPQALYVELLFAVAYTLLFIISFRKTPITLRPPVRKWVAFLLGVYWVGFVANLLVIQFVDLGFCFTGLTVVLYTASYSPFLYNIFLEDSKEVVDAKIFKGTINREHDPLLYYKNQLKQAGTVSTIKLIDFEDIKIGNKIGVGGYGEVFKGRWNKLDVAVKRIFKKTTNEGDVDEFLKEVQVQSPLTHPNILLLLGVCVSPTGLYIITEYMSRGSLYNILHGDTLSRDRTPSTLVYKPTVEQKLKLMLDAARGMIYLHTLRPPIIHRDLKTQNLLVDEYWRGKLCDFGLSRIKASETMSRLGTIQYSAPEILRGERYTESADTFSYGIMMWETFAEKIPYDGWAPLKIASDVAYQMRRPDFPPKIIPAIKTLIEAAWEEVQESRPTFDEIASKLEDIIVDIQAGTYDDSVVVVGNIQEGKK